jgi:hypothetical protein
MGLHGFADLGFKPLDAYALTYRNAAEILEETYYILLVPVE